MNNTWRICVVETFIYIVNPLQRVTHRCVIEDLNLLYSIVSRYSEANTSKFREIIEEILAVGIEQITVSTLPQQLPISKASKCLYVFLIYCFTYTHTHIQHTTHIKAIYKCMRYIGHVLCNRICRRVIQYYVHQYYLWRYSKDDETRDVIYYAPLHWHHVAESEYKCQTIWEESISIVHIIVSRKHIF